MAPAAINNDDATCSVRTIDVWYSNRRQIWVVERLDGDGNQIGAAQACPDETDVRACIAEWLRYHPGIEFIALYGLGADAKVAAKSPRRAA